MPMICEGLPEIACDGLPPSDISTGLRLVVNSLTVVESPVLVGASDVDESGVSLYGSVVRDGGVYRMWYQAWPKDWATSSNLEDIVAVACVESDDGLTWRQNGSMARHRSPRAPWYLTNTTTGSRFRDTDLTIARSSPEINWKPRFAGNRAGPGQ